MNSMTQRPYLSIIVPAYDEAGSLRRTFAAMRAFLDAAGYSYEVILASDGTDDTPAIAAEIALGWPNLILSMESGRHGKGHGVRRGAALATGDIVSFMDADYKTPIEEVTKLLPWLEQGYDLAIGSRGLAASRIDRRQPWFRRLGSRGFAVLMHAIVGLPEVTDTQCGFKCFSRHAAADIFSRARIDGYMFDVEILYLANQLGYRVKEIGIRWSDDGDSRLALVSGNLRNVIDLLRIRFGTPALRPARITVPLTTPGVGSSRES